jgi:hypothetical protein
MFKTFLHSHSLRVLGVAGALLSVPFLSVDVFAAASGCVALTMQKDRSPGASILSNDCYELSNLSLGSVMQMNGGARLWLKSNSAAQTDSSFQIICQNKSSDLLQIEVSSAFIPWIKPKNIAHCNDWVGDRLTCNDANSGSPILYCAIAMIKNLSVNNDIERKTSVTMRGIDAQGDLKPLDQSESQQLEKIIDFIKPEIDLCRKVFQTDQAVSITWTISTNGQVLNAYGHEERGENHFAGCALEAVEHFNFPSFSKDIQISYTF